MSETSHSQKVIVSLFWHETVFSESLRNFLGSISAAASVVGPIIGEAMAVSTT
jgi:hypothetical protein